VPSSCTTCSIADRQHLHLESLNTLLSSVRKPYLSLTEPPLNRRHRPARHDGEGDGDELARWKGTTYLSDRERDEIDTRGKMILRRCKDRLSDLERSEQGTSSKIHRRGG
jgi:syntaxin 18